MMQSQNIRQGERRLIDLVEPLKEPQRREITYPVSVMVIKEFVGVAILKVASCWAAFLEAHSFRRVAVCSD